MTQRVGFVLRVKPERVDDYVRAHREVWPEMLEALKGAGSGTTRSSATATGCSGTSRLTTCGGGGVPRTAGGLDALARRNGRSA
jgi:hypothetical protein